MPSPQPHHPPQTLLHRRQFLGVDGGERGTFDGGMAAP